MLSQELLSDREAEVRKLSGKLADGEAALASLAGKLEEAAKELRQLKSKQEEAAVAAAGARGVGGGGEGGEEKVEEAEGPSAKQLQHELNAARAAAVEAETLRAVAAEQLREAQVALSGARVELEEVRVELRGSRGECEKLRAGAEGLRGRVRELERELQEGVAERERAVAEAQGVVGVLQEKVAALEKQRDELLLQQQQQQEKERQQQQQNSTEAKRAASGGSGGVVAHDEKGWQLVPSGSSTCLEPATPDQATGAAAAAAVAAAATNAHQAGLAAAENGTAYDKGVGGGKEGRTSSLKNEGTGSEDTAVTSEAGPLGFKLLLAQAEVQSLKGELCEMQQQWQQLLQLIRSNAASERDEAENNSAEEDLGGEQQQGLLLQLVEGLQVRYTGPSWQHQLRMEGRQMEALLGLALEQVQLLRETAELNGAGSREGLESFEDGLGSTLGSTMGVGISREVSAVAGKLNLGLSGAAGVEGGGAGMYGLGSSGIGGLQSNAVGGAAAAAGVAVSGSLSTGDLVPHGIGVQGLGLSKGVSEPSPVVSMGWDNGVSERGGAAGGLGGVGGVEDLGLEDAWWNKPTVSEPVMELPDFLLKR
jgi:hypothetical protein